VTGIMSGVCQGRMWQASAPVTGYNESAAVVLLVHLQLAIRPYLIDLDTVNGTFLNGERIEGSRYYELLPKVRGLLLSI
jgi:smad nuclear-interacting protein 1